MMCDFGLVCGGCFVTAWQVVCDLCVIGVVADDDVTDVLATV